MKEGEKQVLRFLAFSVALHSVACGHTFFHEPSAILVKSGGEPDPHSDFGFAMSHWKESLIVSSPSIDLIGEVYRCPLDIQDKSLNCSLLNLFNSNNTEREKYPDQKFFLGASISATDDFLFTCAPLVTKNVRKSSDIKTIKDAVGSCFIYSNNVSTEYRGPEGRFINGNDGYTGRFAGGTGWNTLADRENGFLLVAKTSVSGDMNYISISNPSALSASVFPKLSIEYLSVGYGMAAGKFFSNKTVYAFSKQNRAMTGQILFLEKRKNELRIMAKRKHPYEIKNEVVGAMFGYALGAADLNSDGFSELLVGAPLQSEDKDEVEVGAIHIYLGGDIKKINDVNRIRTIFGAKSKGRFGSTIASSDIDGDGIAEVFVSALYEDTGVVYILSGYDLKHMLQQSSLSVQVLKLQHSQRVVRSDLTRLGFSLLTVPDVDENGCNELAIGAPGSASVLLLRCLQAINVTITSEVVGTNVWEIDDNCTVKICLNVEFNRKTNISGYITVKNNIDGYAIIQNSSYRVDLSEKNETYCNDIFINFPYHEKFDYKFKSNLELDNIETLKSEVYDKTWVQLSIYSETNRNLPISRRCRGVDCLTRLSLNIEWDGAKSTHLYESKGMKKKTFEKKRYEVESSNEETVSILVENKGFQVSDACVWVEITGAPVYKPGKCSPKPPQNPKGYECLLPSPFRRNESAVYDIFLNMSRLSNADTALVVKAWTYEDCSKHVRNTSEEKILMVNYEFEQAWQKVQLEGNKHDLQITDIEIEEGIKKNDANNDNKESISKDDQEYRITNIGSVTWNRSIAVIEVETRTFITTVETTEENCTVSKGEKQYTIICPLTLPPGTTKKIIASAEMSIKEIGEHLNGGRKINVTSQMKICMDSVENVYCIQKRLVTDIKIKQDYSFKNNKTLIGLIAAILALLLLALVIFCLCKKGFFKREEKKKLNVLRESVRRRSIRLASEKSSRLSQKTPSNVDDDNDIDIEVVEDSPFEEIPISTNDDVVLMEAQADVHHENNAKKGKKADHTKSA